MTTTLTRWTAQSNQGKLQQLSKELAQRASVYDHSGKFPAESIRLAHQAGVFEATVAAEYGGAAASAVEAARLIEALGQGDPSVALIVANTLAAHSANQPAAVQAGRAWPAGLYRQALDRATTEPVLINTARAEPELGAPARGGLPKTTARRCGDQWLLSGRKAYVTASEGLTYHLVWAITDEDRPRVGHLIVPGDSSGVSIEKTWDHLGLRASSTHDVLYDSVQVPEENFVEIPAQPDGSYRDPAAQGASLNFLAIYLGVARAAQESFTEFTQHRVPTALGKPIAETERIQRIAGEIELQISSVSDQLYDLAAQIDAASADPLLHPSQQRLAQFKTLAARSLVQAVNLAVEALGNPALSRRNPLQRHLRDILSIRVHPPQEDAVVLGLGRRILTNPRRTEGAA